ncbi:hypothetical protein AVEN_113832-1 [Araneus ventricosus]|uniref:Uncharacterized protein n=1 Tax=Araneus ventricosus TaxID=182803 RepID=A0A4Y2KW94_ARAVE|nr:hypothetical protein AVEN_113832-1 [Araneus ventricosus]
MGWRHGRHRSPPHPLVPLRGPYFPATHILPPALAHHPLPSGWRIGNDGSRGTRDVCCVLIGLTAVVVPATPIRVGFHLQNIDSEKKCPLSTMRKKQPVEKGESSGGGAAWSTGTPALVLIGQRGAAFRYCS